METLNVNIKYDGMYKSFSATAGKVTTKFRYEISGSPEAIAAYAKSQGTKLVKKDLNTKGDQLGNPLFFTNRFVGQNSTLNQAQSGSWFPNQEKLEMANSLAEQFPALAGEFARQAAGSVFGSSRTVAGPATEEEGAKKTEENVNVV